MAFDIEMIKKVYARMPAFTQFYQTFTQHLLNIYPTFTQHLPNIYSTFTQHSQHLHTK